MLGGTCLHAETRRFIESGLVTIINVRCKGVVILKEIFCGGEGKRLREEVYPVHLRLVTWKGDVNA